MKILVTNDDSVKAPGLAALARHALDYGAVIIIAPLTEQSAKSHAINIKTGFEIKQYDIGIAAETYYCDSTPADCVRSAHFALQKRFDIVFSGINNGYNLGEDIIYSGTVAAAMAGVFLGKKALAFSAANYAEVSPKVFASIMDYINLKKVFGVSRLLNINIPPAPRGIKITKQGKTQFKTEFVQENGLWHQRGYHRYELDDDINTDVWAVSNDYISITPLASC